MLKRRYTLGLILSFLLVAVKGYSYDFKVNGLCYNKLSESTVELTWKAVNTPYTGDITVPSYVNYNGKKYEVVAIGEYAMVDAISFNNEGKIDSWQTNSKLHSVLLPSSIISIETNAFSMCSALTSMTIPNSVTTIGLSAFSSCSGLTSITIPNSVTSIEGWAFSGCSGLSSVKVDNNNPKYDSRNNCNAIIETSTNTLITGCKNTVIPNSVTSIESSAFQNCSGLTSITIPNSVTSIGSYAFYKCSGLTSITIPNSVTSIGSYAFYKCSGLTDFISEIQNPFGISESVFSSDTYSKATLTVPSGTKSKYQQTNYWNKFTNIVESSSGGASTTRTIHVYPAGSLLSMISETEKYTIEELTLTGELNGTDFRLLRDMAGNNYLGHNTEGKLKTLDLSGAKVVAGGEKYLDTDQIKGNGVSAGGSYHYQITQANEIPKYVFYACYLKNILIPNSVTSIGSSAFGYCRNLTSITIPNSVLSIGNYAFNECSGLISITIPSSVTSIANAAFSCCSGLSAIKVDNNNHKYDSRNNCNAIIETSTNTLIIGCKNTVIPNSVTSIGNYAFEYCSGLTSINIPNSVTSIGYSAFRYCSDLISISISNSVTNIGKGAFNDCGSLSSIKVDNNNQKYDSRNNCNAIIETSTNTLIIGCKNTVIPNSVTSIGEEAFASCDGLTYITIPNSVTSIGNYAFENCSGLTSITIPNSVTSIGNYAFYGCWRLTSITIPNSVTSIGGSAFSGCSGLTSITIPNSVKSIGSGAFYDCSGFTSITIPNSVTNIGQNAFYGCSGLTDVISEIQNPFEIKEDVFSSNTYSKATLTVPSGTKSKYQQTNYWNKFTNIVESSGGGSSTSRTIHVYPAGSLPSLIPETEKYTIEELTLTGELNGTDFRLLRDMAGNNYLGKNTEGKLKTLDLSGAKIVVGGEKYLDTDQIDGNGIGANVSFHYQITEANEIPKYVFFCCNLKNILIPNSVTSIRDHAFGHCRSLTSITIPNSVLSIGNDAFQVCSGLTSITIPNSVTSIGVNAFIDCSSLTTITIPNSVTSIGNGAFYHCSSLTSITIPNSVTSIDTQIFSYCSGLSSIKVDNNNPKYDSRNNCNAIVETSTNTLITGCKNTVIPNSVTSIGKSAFEGCSGLTSITIPNSVANIGWNAFQECSALASITIPNSVTSIGELAFYKCSGLSSIKVDNNNPKYNSRNNCNAIIETSTNTLIIGCKNTVIPNSVTNIGNYAFYDCSGLTSITIPNSVTSIGNYAFYYCSGLTDVISEIQNPFEITEDVFLSNTYSKATLTVPSGTKSKYQQTNYWNKFTNIVESSGGGSSTSRTIHVYPAGSLPSLIPETEKYTIEELTLTGELNGTDFRLLRDMAGCNYLGEETDGKLKVLDFSGAKVVAGGEKYVDTNSLPGRIASFHYTVDRNNELPPNIFHGCKFTSIRISTSLTSIGNSAFYGCSGLTSITIPNSVISIEYHAFYKCDGLTSITIPNSVTSIDHSAFESCSMLTSIKVESGNTKYDSRNNCNAIIETSTNILIIGCKNTVIPNSVTSIGIGAFYGCSGLTSITIPNSVTSIGQNAFSFCSGLYSIKVDNNNPKYDSRNNCNAIIEASTNTLITGCKNTLIPNSVTSIGSDAFCGCSGLTSITIPNSVTSIGDYAFFSCNTLSSIAIPNSVTTIGSYAFSKCSDLTSITIPNSVTSIGSDAFWDCSGLTSITIPSSVTSIGDYAFYQCSGLTSIKVDNNNPKYDSRNNCNAIIETLTNRLITGCKNTVIPNSVTSIGNYAFYYCRGLTSITIPNSVTNIGSNAFYGCSSLTDVISEIQNPFEIEEWVFSSSYTKATLTVPLGTKTKYQQTNYWNKFTNIVEKEADNIIPGDANGDTEVNVSDIVEVVNFIMDNPSAIFLKANADINGDGEVNVTDIVMIVNIIMSAQYSAACTMSNRAGSMTDVDCLTIDDVTINAGETKQVSIGLNNPDKKYTAFQFDLTLPEGITIAKNSNGKLMASLDTERKDDHTLSVSELGNNTYRLLAFSMSNAELYGTSGALVNITLEADANMDSGTNAAALKSQVFTATDGTQYKWSDLPFSIQINKNTGIDEISKNGQKEGIVKVYTLPGLLLFSVPKSEFSEKWRVLPSGVYIVNGQKITKLDDSK